MKKILQHLEKKVIPQSILKEANIALSFYPELKSVPIEIKFKDQIEKSFMQAQPKFSTVFKGKKNREYIIYISRKFNIENEELTVFDVPSEVLIGWLGHELGHIMDYLNRSAFNLIFFGLKYIVFNNHIRKAEKAADTYAIYHGMSEYILQTKNFILNHTSLSDNYKERIKRLYLSPEDIMLLANEIKSGS
ncbi:hypothetical protein ACG2LH_11195 [Zhouia sp. PK063]|uniref:hypothetical protein n=1 Tax=Zhouia sp. PK063 TaxID=3373602 RepID=UPI0037B41BF0